MLAIKKYNINYFGIVQGIPGQAVRNEDAAHTGRDRGSKPLPAAEAPGSPGSTVFPADENSVVVPESRPGHGHTP